MASEAAATEATAAATARRRALWATLAVTLALLALPPIVDLAVGGIRRAFDYFTSDTYYYLVVARNIVDRGRISFDGTLGTNGFHPAWQLTVAALFGVARLMRLGEPTIMVLTLLVGVALIAAALAFLGRALAAERSAGLSPLFVTLPVGLYSLCLWPVWLREPGLEKTTALFGTLWGYVNGMESALLLLAYGLCAWWFVTRPVLSRDRDALVLGLLLALLVLARLDHVFLPAALLGGLLAATLHDRAARRRVLIAAAACAAPVALYCAINWVALGTPLPVSGAIKSTFPRIHHGNVDRVILSVLHPARQTWYRLYRVAQLVIPAAMALVCLLVELRPRRQLPWLRLRAAAGQLESFLVATAVGVLAVSLYDLCFVELADQGSWYAPIGTLFTSLYPLVLLGRTQLLQRLDRRLPWRVAVLLAGAVTGVAFFARYERAIDAQRRWADFYFEEAPLVRKFYEGKSPHFVEVDDGIFTFSTGFPAMAGKGFVLDPEAARALKQNALVPLAVERGYNRITSVLYMDVRGLTATSPSEMACNRVSGITPAKLCERYRFSLEYAHGPFGVIRVDPR